MQHYLRKQKTREHNVQIVGTYAIHLTINVPWKSMFRFLPEEENKIQGVLCLGKLGATTLKPIALQWIYNKMRSDFFCELHAQQIIFCLCCYKTLSKWSVHLTILISSWNFAIYFLKVFSGTKLRCPVPPDGQWRQVSVENKVKTNKHSVHLQESGLASSLFQFFSLFFSFIFKYISLLSRSYRNQNFTSIPVFHAEKKF